MSRIRVNHLLLAGVLAVTCGASAWEPTKPVVPDPVHIADPEPVSRPAPPVVVVPPEPVVRVALQEPLLPLTNNGIPATVLDAYRRAAERSAPGCHLRWQLLAGIGEVESGHAGGGRVDALGTALRPILGPVLDGSAGNAAIRDTDQGRLDGDAVWDRAVGPMQFIPSTWRRWAVDGNGDGVTDPENAYDAAASAASYLCANGRDLAVPADLDAAVLSYNASGRYLDLVLRWTAAYSGAVASIPDQRSVIVPVVAKPPAPEPKPTPPVSPTPSPTPQPSQPTRPADPVTAVVGGVSSLLTSLVSVPWRR